MPNLKTILAAILCAAVLTVPVCAAEISFTDVAEGAWYYQDVKAAVEEGLVNGRSEDAFCPDEHMTCAEAVKLAACMHEKKNAGAVTLENGDPWYAPYVEYAKTNGIIEGDYAWGDPIVREDYMAIFARALPAEEYAVINEIADGALPDVPADAPNADGIYKLARAGIVQGDENRNINPGSPIRRCEVAAILTRMMNPDARVRFTVKKTVRAADFTGSWQDSTSQRASLTIMASEEYPYYDVRILWGSGANSAGEWTMKASFDEETGRMTYENGAMAYLTTHENGEITRDEKWADAKGSFAIGADGIMTWEDSREERSGEFRLVHLDIPAPTPEELVENYFKVIGGIQPGTAGSSLRQAQAISSTLSFAGLGHDLWAADIPALRENLLTAWESLTEDEQKAFDESFIPVLTQMRDAWEDWDANSGPFMDAGVGDAMMSLMPLRSSRLSWDVLTSNTLTMGNTDGD